MDRTKYGELLEGLARLNAKHGHFQLHCPFGDIVTVVALVQLALRHPGTKGYSAEVGHRIANDIIDTLGKTEPRVAELLREGFDPAHDVGVN